MSKKINKFSYEYRNANLTLMSTLLNSLFTMLSGFLIVKLTISMYGEPINGVIRFIAQIFAYLLIVLSSISMVFSVQIIKYYRKKQWAHIDWIYSYMRKVWRYLSLFYILIFIIAGVVISKMLSSKGSNIGFIFVFALFGALAIQSIFSVIFLRKYNMYYTSINKGYIYIMVSLATSIIFFAYFLIMMVIFPPNLHRVINPATGAIIITFIKGDTRIYNIIISFSIYSLSPLISSIILHIKYKKDKNNRPITYQIISDEDKRQIKSEIWKNLKFAFLLSGTAIVVNNTDEFVILMLKNSANSNYILKMVSIYGIYSSIFLSLFTLAANYIRSKKVLIGLLEQKSKERNTYMKTLRIETYLIGAIAFSIFIFIVPLLVNTLFNPTNSPALYFNTSFSIPFTILFILQLIYLPDMLMFEIDNKFNWLSIASSTEAILNIVLSISLIGILGLYWVMWASAIALFIKIIIIKIIILNQYTHYAHFSYLRNKKTYMMFFFVLVSIIESIVFYMINYHIIFMFIKHYYYIFIIVFEALIVLYATWKIKRMKIINIK